MDMAEWLRGLGLEQYAPAFRDNDIDGEVLRRLTAEDLRELGVASIGHRRRLLDAIAALDAGGSGAIPSETAAPSHPRPDHRPPAGEGSVGGEAERRQITVMFCDLVGSTALAGRHDPEDLREIVGVYHRVVADTVGRFAGFVAKYMGDGVLVYFGYPQAHEDDSERAVRAGLAVVDAVAGLDIPERLAVRLGIASGLVVVGDLLGEGAAQERGVVGETPNLAARLQGLADPGTAVIADSTRRQLGGLFDVADLGPQQLAGFAEPQRVWRVLGESEVISRFEALRSDATPLVGRDEELDLLLRRWQQAKAGEGRVVLISGEPGIGKSRLTAALSERIAGERHTRLRYFCSPHHQDSALYPFIAQLERAAGFARDDTTEARLDKLRTLLAPGARDDDDLALFSELMSLPSSAAELNLSPQRKREKLFEALLHQLEGVARQQPVLMVLEDGHWIDPTSREFTDLTLDRVRRLPVLLVVTFRPEFQHDWGGQPNVTLMSLNRLGVRDGVALVERLAGNVGLPREIVDEIVERTDGVPLFVEELTKAVLESGGGDNRVEAVLSASPLPRLGVPAALHASLVARLDRLGPMAREIAQIGAVLGREFSYELVVRVAQRAHAHLQSALAALTGAGLLFCRGVAPHSTYLFKHALIQDAAYETLLRTRRRELHRVAARTIADQFPALAEAEPEVMARHWSEAGEAEPALAAWRKAGDIGRARNAFIEGREAYRHALEILATMPASLERDAAELELLIAINQIIWATKGYNTPDSAGINARARELAEKIGNLGRLVQQLYGAWTASIVAGTYASSIALSDQLLDAAQRDGSELSLGLAANAQFVTPQFRGEFIEAEKRLAWGEPYLAAPGLSQFFAAGWTISIAGWNAWILGRPDQARARIRRAFATIGDDAFARASVQWVAAKLHVMFQEPERAAAVADQAIALCDERGFREIGWWAKGERGWALARLGRVDEGLSLAGDALTASREGGSSPLITIQLTCLAEVQALSGALTDAVRRLDEALTLVPEEGCWRPEAIRLRGEVRRRDGKEEMAEADFRDAIVLAQEMSAKGWELRAATSLARLWGEQGRREEARDLLAPIYGWFTEGFDTADLKEAKALLAELA